MSSFHIKLILHRFLDRHESIRGLKNNILSLVYIWFVNGFYRYFFHKRPLYDKKYNISICGIFKNEAPFLKEWIVYHEMIGVEHFWLYNNNSTDNYKEILEPYMQQGLVTLINWPHDQSQIRAYKDFFDNYRHQTQWYSFLDIDEFFVPKYEINLLNWLKKSKLDKFPALVIYYRMFGTSGKIHHDYGDLLIEQYHACWEHLYNVGKCLINSDYEICQFNSLTHHWPLIRTKKIGITFSVRPFNMYGKCVLFHDTQRKQSDSKGTIQINHYWSKAWDAYEKKRNMTDVFFKENPKRNLSYFYFHEDKNISVDYSITKFIIRLKFRIYKNE